MAAVAAPTVELNVTPSAAVEIKKFLAGEEDLPETAGLRVRVVPGGCSGFQYSLDIEKDERPGDMVFEVKGVKCFVDPMSSMYLLGVEVDYVEGQFGQSGFSFKNPNAKHTCGCGSSFSA